MFDLDYLVRGYEVQYSQRCIRWQIYDFLVDGNDSVCSVIIYHNFQSNQMPKFDLENQLLIS